MADVPPSPDVADARRIAAPHLRTALAAAEYTVKGVEAVLVPRTRTTSDPVDRILAQRATAGGSARETLIRLFLLTMPVPGPAAAVALAPLALEDAIGTGLLERDGGDVRAGLDLRPHADVTGGWWVFSDLGTDAGRGPLATDHVLGIGGASVSLAGSTVRCSVASALDVGTGCGIQALHLARHARSVVATDRNPRALALARWTAQLNGLDWELLRGDLLAPVLGRRFDLVVSNPPFVPGAPAGARFLYRDSGYDGDDVCSRLVRGVPEVLTEGGWCQVLASWLHRRGEPWQERVAGWLAQSGCDAWVVQRDVLDPAAHVRMWLADSGSPAAGPLAEQWLDWFTATGVEAIGFGLISMRRVDRTDPAVRIEDLATASALPSGAAVHALFGRRDRWRGSPVEGLRLTAHPALRLESEATRTAEGWSAREQTLVLGDRRVAVDPAIAALVAGCSGRPRVGELLDLLAAVHEMDRAALTAAAVAVLAELVELGILEITGTV